MNSMDAKLSDIPRNYRESYLKAMSGKSRVCAIKSQCLECVGWNKEEVKKCTSVLCSLYPYRPYTV